MMHYKDETATYRLNGHNIECPDGEGGWYVLDDDCPHERDIFEARCDFYSEEIRILHAEALIEFGL